MSMSLGRGGALLSFALLASATLSAGDQKSGPGQRQDLSSLPDAVRQEVAKLQGSDAIQRIYAIRALGAMGSGAAPAVPFLVQTLTDDPPNLFINNGASLTTTSPAREAVDALAKIGQAAVSDLVVTVKAPPVGRDDAWKARWFAAMTLGRIGGRAAVGALVEALGDSETNVRHEAVTALGKLRDPSAVDRLIDLVQDKSDWVRTAAVEALRSTTGKGFGENASEWKKWRQENKK